MTIRKIDRQPAIECISGGFKIRHEPESGFCYIHRTIVGGVLDGHHKVNMQDLDGLIECLTEFRNEMKNEPNVFGVSNGASI